MTDKPPPKFKVGQKVSFEKWNKTVPPSLRLYGYKVIAVRESCTQSGWHYSLRCPDGYTIGIDEDWISKEER